MILARNDIILPARTLASTTSQIIDLIGLDTVALTINYANATTAGKTFVVLSQPNDTLTVTAHGWVTGLKGQATNSGGALPTGISGSTDYFVIVVDANTIKLADSLVHAVAGTAIDITGAGTGTQTFTPTTSAGNVIKAQFSCDGVGFTDITPTNFPQCPSATVTVATSTSFVTWDFQRPAARYLNILYTPSAGQITFSATISAKVDQ